jgi:hypothetical protein
MLDVSIRRKLKHKHTHRMQIGTKNLAISDEADKMLKALKKVWQKLH